MTDANTVYCFSLNNLMASRLQADEEARRLNSELQTSLTEYVLVNMYQALVNPS